MNIAFTICSNNYLAQAKTLGQSFLKFHPEFKFIIALVDKWSNDVNTAGYNDFVIVPVEDLRIDNLSSLIEKYNIVELNTSVKPSYFKYLFQKFDAANVIYLDPDILVLSRFEEVLEILKIKNIIITPHICTPIDDEYAPTDYHTIRGGVFNLGFIALSSYNNVKGFLSWWHARVVKYGFGDFSLNMFYDQLWINYVPTLYDNYHILKHYGYNMANWNLHERHLSIVADRYIVNEKTFLRFFHFSSYKFNNPEVICSYLTRYDFVSRPDLVPLFNYYRELLIQNGIEAISRILPSYYQKIDEAPQPKPVPSSTPLVNRLFSRLKRSGKVLLLGHE